MRLAYENWKPGDAALDVIAAAETIARDYRQQGYDLTLRQLYYQFVARGLLPNNDRSYKRLGSIVNRARMAGLFDWNYIVDRTRNVAGYRGHEGRDMEPADAIKQAVNYYSLDWWKTQTVRIEVWVEKEALAGVIQRATGQYRLPYFSCRGYVSQSEQWAAAQRHYQHLRAGKRVVVLHLGDHDPSGIDMTRDIRERLQTFVAHDHIRAGGLGSTFSTLERDLINRYGLVDTAGDPLSSTPVEVRRIALNWDQIQQYQPPPNPAKQTDSRSRDYIDRFGDESWELDALDPSVLVQLVTDEVEAEIDQVAYDARQQEENEGEDVIARVADNYDLVEQFLTDSGL